MISENLGSLDLWEFQYSIPVIYSEYRTIIPEYYIFKPTLKGYITPKISTENRNETAHISSKERTGIYISSTTFSQNQFSYNEAKTIYSLSNIPALKDESFVNNIKNYLASVEHELTAVHFPNQPFKNLSTDWETVVKTIYDNENFGAELNKTGYFEKDIDALIAEKIILKKRYI